MNSYIFDIALLIQSVTVQAASKKMLFSLETNPVLLQILVFQIDYLYSMSLPRLFITALYKNFICPNTSGNLAKTRKKAETHLARC